MYHDGMESRWGHAIAHSAACRESCSPVGRSVCAGSCASSQRFRRIKAKAASWKVAVILLPFRSNDCEPTYCCLSLMMPAGTFCWHFLSTLYVHVHSPTQTEQRLKLCFLRPCPTEGFELLLAMSAIHELLLSSPLLSLQSDKGGVCTWNEGPDSSATSCTQLASVARPLHSGKGPSLEGHCKQANKYAGRCDRMLPAPYCSA